MSYIYGPADKPSADKFAEVLQKEPRWFSLGKFIGTPRYVLDSINMNYGTTHDVLRCLLEVHNCLEQRDKLPNWGTIADALRRMGNDKLANTICPKPKAVTVKTEVITIEDDDHVTPHIEPNSVKQEKQDDYNQSDTRLHRLRSRSYSGEEPPVKRKPSSTLHDSDGQDSISRCKLLISSLRKYHNDICANLCMSNTTLSSLVTCLYSVDVIDKAFKLTIQRNKTHDKASNLLDHISDYIKGGDDNIKRYEVVMKCLEKQKSLRDIVTKMKKYMEEITDEDSD